MAVAYYYSSTASEYSLTGSINSTATVLSLSSVQGLPGGLPYKVVIDVGQLTEEVVKVTAIAGTSLTVVRGWDGTAAVSHTAGAKVRHMMTAEDLTLARAHEDSTTAHGATGAVVGTTSAQTLVNKNLTSASNTFPNTLVTLDGAQTLTGKSFTPLSTNQRAANFVALAGQNALITAWTDANGNAIASVDKDFNFTGPTITALNAKDAAQDAKDAAQDVAIAAAVAVNTTQNSRLTALENDYSGNIATTDITGGWAVAACTGTRVGRLACIRANVTRTFATPIGPSGSGSITDSPMFAMTAGWIPASLTYGYPGEFPIATFSMTPGNGWVSMTSLMPGYTINNGDSIYLGFTYILA